MLNLEGEQIENKINNIFVRIIVFQLNIEK